MYIAFKWLVGLAFTMWISMCVIDVCLKNSDKNTGKNIGTPSIEWVYKNLTLQLQQDPEFPAQKKYYSEKYEQYYVAVLHYTMFFAGAIAVSVYNRKSEIISYTKNTIAKIDLIAIMITIAQSFKKPAITILRFTMKNFAVFSWGNICAVVWKIRNIRFNKHKKINIILLQKLREFGEERTKLGQLLIAAVRDNKNIRMQYQLETMAKNRLVKYIEDTQQKSKENRSRYVSFQHLYLVTHQENVFLKARLRKITQEKEEAEKDLMTIVDKVYQSKNNDLIAYCCRFIVKPKENLLNRDVKAEVRKFLGRSKTINTSTLHTNSKIDKGLLTEGMEILQEDATLIPLVSDAPRLKGLPGECIWTVKDKDGLIEKLYECDFESNLDNGDIIRRIRKYSVYFDKDCLLDFSRSRTVVSDLNDLRPVYPRNVRFLTGSEAFQKFLRNNQSFAPSSRSTRSLKSVTF